MAADLIQRRLVRSIRSGVKGFRPAISAHDIARWLNLPGASPVYQWARGRVPISKTAQVRLSQLFTMIDEGRIVLRVSGRHKTWERVEEPKPPCKVPQPRIDFADLTLKFD